MSDLITSDELLSMDQFKAALPKEARMRVSEEMVDHINELISQPDLRENYRDNLLSFANVVSTGKYKLQTYVDAVRFVSYKLLGHSALQAYAKTFPERYNRLVSEGADNNTISAYSSAFNKTAIVNKIFEQTLVPSYILNSDYFQKAINKQMYLVMHAKSEAIQQKAADSLMTHLKPPESQKIELSVGITDDKSIQELREVTAQLAAKQKGMIESGLMNTKEVAHSRIINNADTD